MRLLLANVRQRGRAWPKCAAREMPVSRRWERHPKYPWCEARAPWRWGEQDLCVEHAAQLALTRRVAGINPDGKWS